jgi:hypothetical protein
MKRSIVTLTFLVAFISYSFSQSVTVKEYKVGHVYYVNIPDYMSKTSDLNDVASIQFTNSAYDIAGYIIEDTKADLEFAKMQFSSVNDFYNNFIKDFIIDQKTRVVSQPITQTIGDNNFVECDVTYYDKKSKTDIYFFVGIAETKNAFYKLLCFGGLSSKDKFKPDFQKILYSIKD